MGGTFGPRLQRLADGTRDLVIADLARCARPWLVIKTVQAALGKTIAPRADRVLADPKLLGNRLVHETIGRCQHDTSPICKRLWRAVLARQCGQSPLLRLIQLNRNCPPFAHVRSCHPSTAGM
jgi:hypothetical protein